MFNCRSISLKPIRGRGAGIIRISQTFVGAFLLTLVVKIPIAVSEPILPCLDSGNECVEELSERAIANSEQLKTIETKIGLIDERIDLTEEKIGNAKDKKFLNYISTNPVEILKNLFGGGDVQRDRIAIVSLEIRTSDLIAARAELERQQVEEKVEIRDRILRLLLDYEAAQRRHENLNNQLETLDKQEQVIRIQYRLGRGSTNQVLGISDKRDRLVEKIVEVEIKQDEAVREIGQLVN